VPTYLYLSLVFVAAMVMQHQELPLRRGVRFGGRGRTRVATTPTATASPIVRRKVR
jgi:hypothetical protein